MNVEEVVPAEIYSAPLHERTRSFICRSSGTDDAWNASPTASQRHVMAKYLPNIIDGFGLTVVLALCFIVAGLVLVCCRGWCGPSASGR